MPRVKDDNKPRGRMSSYAYFVQTCREEHKRKYPNETIAFAAFSKKCSDHWKVMSDKEKKRFVDMADQDKLRFNMEMESYVPPPFSGKGKGSRRKKDPNAPKRSLSAFFCFCQDERPGIRAAHPAYSVGDVAKELGRKWAECSEDDKKKYNAMAEKDKERYEREMEVYRNGGLGGASGAVMMQYDDE